jgi:hypothetical protein
MASIRKRTIPIERPPLAKLVPSFLHYIKTNKLMYHGSTLFWNICILFMFLNVKTINACKGLRQTWTSSLDWTTVSRFLYLRTKGRWIMSNKSIIVLVYHRRQHPNYIYCLLFLLQSLLSGSSVLLFKRLR